MGANIIANKVAAMLAAWRVYTVEFNVRFRNIKFYLITYTFGLFDKQLIIISLIVLSLHISMSVYMKLTR